LKREIVEIIPSPKKEIEEPKITAVNSGESSIIGLELIQEKNKSKELDNKAMELKIELKKITMDEIKMKIEAKKLGIDIS